MWTVTGGSEDKQLSMSEQVSAMEISLPNQASASEFLIGIRDIWEACLKLQWPAPQPAVLISLGDGLAYTFSEFLRWIKWPVKGEHRTRFLSHPGLHKEQWSETGIPDMLTQSDQRFVGKQQRTLWPRSPWRGRHHLCSKEIYQRLLDEALLASAKPT